MHACLSEHDSCQMMFLIQLPFGKHVGRTVQIFEQIGPKETDKYFFVNSVIQSNIYIFHDHPMLIQRFTRKWLSLVKHLLKIKWYYGTAVKIFSSTQI